MTSDEFHRPQTGPTLACRSCEKGQAGAESAFSILSQGLAGLNLIHDVGYLGAGMICSPEMLVMGDEICGMTRHFLRGIEINTETLATEAIDEVGPGGNFVQSLHTFKHFKNETWFPSLMKRNYQDKWVKKGKPSTQDSVREKLTNIIDTHQPIPLGSHERSELKRLRKEGEEVLDKSQ